MGKIVTIKKRCSGTIATTNRSIIRTNTSGFHWRPSWLHHRGPSGVTHHVSWLTHWRASHVHWRSSHVRGWPACHLTHVYRWSLVGRWSCHVAPTKGSDTVKQIFKQIFKFFVLQSLHWLRSVLFFMKSNNSWLSEIDFQSWIKLLLKQMEHFLLLQRLRNMTTNGRESSRGQRCTPDTSEQDL